MALNQLTEEQIRTWTREQKDAWWLANVYRGDMPQLTLRSGLTGFVLGGVVVDDRPVAQIAAEVVALHADFPIGLAADARLVDAFGGPAAIRAIPTAFLLGRDGALARTYAGFEPLSALRDDISRVLDGQPLPSKTPKTP